MFREKLKCGGYRLIFMDVNMPVMGGIEATQEIRMMCTGAEQPFIVGTTGGVDSATEEQCRSCGMDHICMREYILCFVVLKPVEKSKIGDIIQKLKRSGSV